MELSKVTSKTVEEGLLLLANLTRTDASRKGLPTYGGFKDDAPYLSEYKEDEKEDFFGLQKKKGDYLGRYFNEEKTYLYFFKEEDTTFHKADLRIEEAAKMESSTIGITEEPWFLSISSSLQLNAYLPFRLMELGLPQSYFQRKAKWLLKAYEIIRIGASEDERSHISHETTLQYLFLIMRQGDIPVSYTHLTLPTTPYV